MNVTDTSRRIHFPPWPLVVVVIGWLWAGITFLYFAVMWSSLSHVVMAIVSILLPLGVCLRWRAFFWLSALAYAVSLGSTIGSIMNLESVGATLVGRLILGIMLLAFHQLSSALTWLHFRKRRTTRLVFWFLVAVLCVVSEFTWVILFPSA